MSDSDFVDFSDSEQEKILPFDSFNIEAKPKDSLNIYGEMINNIIEDNSIEWEDKLLNIFSLLTIIFNDKYDQLKNHKIFNIITTVTQEKTSTKTMCQVLKNIYPNLTEKETHIAGASLTICLVLMLSHFSSTNVTTSTVDIKNMTTDSAENFTTGIMESNMTGNNFTTMIGTDNTTTVNIDLDPD